MDATQRSHFRAGPRLAGALAVLLGMVITGCAVARPPHGATDAAPARLGDGVPETEPSAQTSPEKGPTVTVPRSVWDELQRKALAADAETRPPHNERLAPGALMGGAVRWYTGGEIAEIVEPWSLGIPARVYLDFPRAGKWGLGIYLLAALYDVPIKHSEMWWSARSVGGGFRLLYSYAEAGDVYLQVDGSYVQWFGQEDDRQTHPNFSKPTIFRSDGFGRIEPRDVGGIEIGVGAATTFHLGEVVDLVSELNFRHLEGTDKWAGEWVEWTVGLGFRF